MKAYVDLAVMICNCWLRYWDCLEQAEAVKLT